MVYFNACCPLNIIKINKTKSLFQFHKCNGKVRQLINSEILSCIQVDQQNTCTALLLYSTDHYLRTNAYICEVGSERNENNEYRWVLPYSNPCECTSVIMGGVNTWTPIRPFLPVYAVSPLISDDINAIREHYGIKCEGESKLTVVASLIELLVIQAQHGFSLKNRMMHPWAQKIPTGFQI